MRFTYWRMSADAHAHDPDHAPEDELTKAQLYNRLEGWVHDVALAVRELEANAGAWHRLTDFAFYRAVAHYEADEVGELEQTANQEAERAAKIYQKKIDAGAVRCTCNALEEMEKLRHPGHAPDCLLETAWYDALDSAKEQLYDEQLAEAEAGIDALEAAGELEQTVEPVPTDRPSACRRCNGLRTIPNRDDRSLNVREYCPDCNPDGSRSKPELKINFTLKTPLD